MSLHQNPHEGKPAAAAISSCLKDQELRRVQEVRRERRWRNLRAGFPAPSILAGPL